MSNCASLEEGTKRKYSRNLSGTSLVFVLS